MLKNQEGFTFVAILIVVIVVSIVVFLGVKNQNKVFEPVVDEFTKTIVSPTPTQFPFQEMTIPYLRNNIFESKLGEMKKVNENTSYTSYIASYNSEGLKIYGLLTIPKESLPQNEEGQSGWPAVIFIHGYIPPQNYNTLVNYVSWVDYLAKNGFVVFKLDLRGHGDSEGEAGGAYYSGDYVVDTLNAYSALQKADFVNPKAIGLWGHSMAGNIVLRSLAAKPDISAVVIWAGAGYTYADLQEYMIQDTSYRPPPTNSERAKKRQRLRELYGNFDVNHWFWKQVPATNYLSDINGSIQLHHAVDDNVVSVDYSRNLVSLLKKTDIKYELKEYPSGGHNLAGSSFTQALRLTSDFFALYLK